MRQSFAEFYRGKTVFVTGHTGFKGAWLSIWLHKLGARVVGFALAPETRSLFAAARLDTRIAHIEGDVRDVDALRRAMTTHKPDMVFHLAAQSLVRPSYRSPRETFDVNVMGTVNVLEAVRATASVRVCEIITSDKCYENREWVYAYRENDAMGGYDPYSASKGAAELAVNSYRNSFFNLQAASNPNVGLASVRAGNVIGGGDWAEDRIIPDCIRALSAGQPIQVRSPHAIRPWQHVLEPLSGYLWLGCKMWQEPATYAQAWNFGPTSAGNVTVRDIVQSVIREWGTGTWNDVSTSQRNALHEATFLKLDCTKASTLLGWTPVYSVQESVAQTIEWYRRQHIEGAGFSAYEFTLRQIDSYTNKAREIMA